MTLSRDAASTSIRLLCASAALCFTASALAGPEWSETFDGESDAGSLPDGAQTPIGQGTLAKIRGRLDGPEDGLGGQAGDFQDLFAIFIDDPTNFSATAVPPLKGDGFQTSLWLFDASGLGLLGSLGSTAGAPFGAFGNEATDNTGLMITEPGIYFIGISGSPSVPVSPGGLIFEFAAPDEVSGPDGPGGSTPVVMWSDGEAFGNYEINLTGVTFVPSPSTLGLLALAGCASLRRRRHS